MCAGTDADYRARNENPADLHDAARGAVVRVRGTSVGTACSRSGVVANLHRLAKHVRPHVVHGHDWLARSFLPLKRPAGPPLVMSLHHYTLSRPKKNLMRSEVPCSGPRLSKCLPCAGRHYGRAKGTAVVLGHELFSRAEAAQVDVFVPVSEATAAGNGRVAAVCPMRSFPTSWPSGRPGATCGAARRTAGGPVSALRRRRAPRQGSARAARRLLAALRATAAGAHRRGLAGSAAAASAGRAPARQVAPTRRCARTPVHARSVTHRFERPYEGVVRGE